MSNEGRTETMPALGAFNDLSNPANRPKTPDTGEELASASNKSQVVTGDLRQWATEGTEYPYRGGQTQEASTLDSQDGKVLDMGNEMQDTSEEREMADREAAMQQPAFPNDSRTPAQGEQVMTAGPEWRVGTSVRTTETALVTPIVTGDTTGSAVVELLETVWDRIRENHPELPVVVIVTGSGMVGSNKWGHFRRDGWAGRPMEESINTNLRLDEMFMAGETLAKGAHQVLQTMLHEGAHTLAKVRGVQDTSRQGRWHNKLFLAAARELGLDYLSQQADKAIGYSQVRLTPATIEQYADLLAELDSAIRLVVHLPGWLDGGTGGGETEGGEHIGRRPTTAEPSTSGNLKLTCECEEPFIIRASRKVAQKATILCEDCDSVFVDRS